MRRWLLLLAFAAGCGSPGPREQYYTLASPSSPAASAAATSQAGSNLSIFVGPVTVPEGVDRSQMVWRIGTNEVEVSDTHRWAEPLKNAIPRLIAETLTRELGTPRVMASRYASTMTFDYKVAVEVQRFESSLTEGASVDALWTITGKGAPRVGRTVAREPAPSADPAGLAAAHSRAIDRVGREIAAALK